MIISASKYVEKFHCIFFKINDTDFACIMQLFELRSGNSNTKLSRKSDLFLNRKFVDW